ncbi:MAG: tRNA epoxyqueuosine(34) reductase QueG [Planctomycetota bacterium]
MIRRCRELGFALAGVATAGRTRYERELRAWLADGRYGEMHYLTRHSAQRVDPARFVPGARSVICVADRYHNGGDGWAGPSLGEPVGRIARYAQGDDYHAVMRMRLRRLADELAGSLRGETFRVCVDTAPVLERELAQRAGLGAVGKHTLLIEPGAGSWLLLGEIVTTAELVPSAPGEADPCRSCTRCIDACPTGAITPWSVDATRCISYLTIEHRSRIDPGLNGQIGDWIFGCDVCQEVCPHNQPTDRSRDLEVHAAYAPRRQGFGLLEVLGWDEQARRDAFVRSAMKRAKLAMMKRNALVAAGNALATGDWPALRRRVEAIAADPAEDDLVRSTARAVISRLPGTAARS